MRATLLLLLLASINLLAEDPASAVVGTATIKLENPVGMVTVPQGDAYQSLFNSMAGGDRILTQSIPPEMIKDRVGDAIKQVFMSLVLASPQMIDKQVTARDFQAYQEQLKQELLAKSPYKDSATPAYEELRKRAAELSAKPAPETPPTTLPTDYLGVLAQTPDSITFLISMNYVQSWNGKNTPRQMYGSLTFFRVKDKLLRAEIYRGNTAMHPEDLDIIKETTEKYIARLLELNKLTAADKPVVKDVPIVVKVGGTEIKLPLPADMADMPKDDPMINAAKKLVPSDCIALRDCLSYGAIDPEKTDDPGDDFMTIHVYAMKDLDTDIDAGTFIDAVEQIARKATHGVIEPKDGFFDYDETQKKLDAFKEETGVELKADSDVYSLGMVSRSVACVSYMDAQYMNVTYKGKTERLKCVSVEAYIRLKKKILIVVTSLNKNTILQGELRLLKHTAEHYQLDLQILNNQ